MRLLLLLLFVVVAPLAAEWSDVMHLAAGERVEVRTKDGAKLRSEFVSATADSIVVRDKTMQRAEISEVRIYDPGRWIGHGLLWTIIGAAAGAGIGFAVCPYCANEGHGAKYVGPGVAEGGGGAGVSDVRRGRGFTSEFVQQSY